MNRASHLALTFLFLQFSMHIASSSPTWIPVVDTTSGVLLGQSVTLDNGDIVNRFLGVPYAQPPLGSLRFEKPQPLNASSGSIVNTQQPKPTCVQMHHLSKTISPLLDWDPIHNISEDCLYMNIYVPANAEKTNLPIMVWLPGEGFDFADARQFNGAYLASMGQVIVITVQYRVGVFGFLKQNAGLWDQLAALRWINANAHKLGGNPEKVTLFGRFTGSMSISILLSSPQTIDSPVALFNRAILMSGVAVGNWVFDKRHDEHVQQVYQNTACTSLNCLKTMPAEKLLTASGYGWKPFIDSELIEDQPLSALQRGRFPKYVESVMLGTNQFEGNLCLLKHLVVDQPFYEKLIRDNVSMSEYEKAIREDLQMFHGEDETNENEDRSLASLITDRAMYVEFCSELLINSHMRQYDQLLLQLTGNAQYSLRDVFNYKLDYKPSFSIAPEFINSSIHGDDVILAFGLAFRTSSLAVTTEDQKISRMMVSLFANFARGDDRFAADSEERYIEIRLNPNCHLFAAICSVSLVSLMVCLIALLSFAIVIVLLLTKIVQSPPTESIKKLLQNQNPPNQLC